ncbi:hypothetical protein U1Q18_019758 [Sarracenia purpurea var. burkii]
MAEIAVNLIIDKLVPLLQEESKLLRGKAWIKQVREVTYQIKNLIDEYILQLIEDIKAIISDIKERGETYGITYADQQGSSSVGNDNIMAWRDPQMASLFIGEDEVLGIESERDELVSWLVEGSPKRMAISVVGMGGSGKTTLAKQVYHNPIVNAHFDFRAWIRVSLCFKMEEVLIAIIKQFYQDTKRNAPDQEMDKMDVWSLIKKLRDYLDEKRYVIFFDDVWDQDFWSFIKNALPDEDKANRVVITTRNNSVTAACQESQFDRIQTLQPLHLTKAWELFCKKAFQVDFRGICPPELEHLSQRIVDRCEVLPLALVTVRWCFGSQREGYSAMGGIF